MSTRWTIRTLALTALFAGCNASSTPGAQPDLSSVIGMADLAVARDLAAPDGDVTPADLASPGGDLAGFRCNPVYSSDLTGVSLVLGAGPCTFTLAQAAAGIQIPYSVAIKASIDNVIPAAQDAGGCGRPDASGLVPFARVTGGNESYCLCDTGRCAPIMRLETLMPGNYSETFSWDGRNWSGPSDFNNPKGAAFPPGTYDLDISATGTVGLANTPFTVRMVLPIRITP